MISVSPKTRKAKKPGKASYILGISCYYHDSSATLLRDGVVIAAAAEERFTRQKHDSGFPENSAKWCLEQGGIRAEDLEAVAFYEKPLLKFERVLYQALEAYPRGFFQFFQSMPSWVKEKLKVRKALRKKLGYKGDVIYLEHHLAHAASAYYPSPFKEAAVLTIDGVGEWATTTLGKAKGDDVWILKQIDFPHSIGLLYSTITAYLGFRVNDSEYKVMGLAAYGEQGKEKNPHYKKLKRIIDLKDDGSFRLDMSYFSYHYKNKMPGKKLCTLLGGPIRRGEKERRGKYTLTKRHKDIAAALQLVTEEAVIKMLNYLHSETECENLVMSGGVALNSVCNGKILQNTPFKRIWIQPDAGDGGTSMGAALYAHTSVLGKGRRYTMTSAQLGPGFDDEEIRSFLAKNKIRHHECRGEEDLIKKTAKMITEGRAVGWFQGRMEWGPRALGTRSILADPTNPRMKDILNSKVKHREKFRPFAPAVCEEDAPEYFETTPGNEHLYKYMLATAPARKRHAALIRSAVHVDGTCRVQAVKREENPRYYNLIKEMGRKNGTPMVINTSFNVRGEPIVRSPSDAYKCMMGTGIDSLAIGRFIVHRRENLKDAWDSEKNAKD